MTRTNYDTDPDASEEKSFYDLPSSSHTFNSRPGAITHETTHILSVGGTKDYALDGKWVYDMASASSLALRYPDVAVENAQNYMYFQESAPRCSESFFTDYFQTFGWIDARESVGTIQCGLHTGIDR